MNRDRLAGTHLLGQPRRGLRLLAIVLGSITLASVAVLMGWDVFPRAFPPRAHLVLGAAPLALIAFSALAFQASRRPRPTEAAKAVILAAAFLFWAANQLLPNVRSATLLNDLAIALFVLDVFLTIIA